MSGYLFSLVFLMAIFVGLMVYGYRHDERLSRRPRVRDGFPPVSFPPRGRRDGPLVHAPNAARFRGPTREAERPSPSVRGT